MDKAVEQRVGLRSRGEVAPDDGGRWGVAAEPANQSPWGSVMQGSGRATRGESERGDSGARLTQVEEPTSVWRRVGELSTLKHDSSANPTHHPPSIVGDSTVQQPRSTVRTSNSSSALKNHMFTRGLCRPPPMISAELAKAALPESPQTHRGKRRSQRSHTFDSANIRGGTNEK
ncbi:unnamed protein product [Pleuronectes platessa]|uniref:Uncharacterized protein n=1 Tax=Pleuronectes platessa TaxID=8262 RepID=A0A9N7Y1K4_PLEPL|nr:unnamed protein product [Pleuronectes platessa]